MKAAARAIRAIFHRGFLPCALEVADQFTLDAVRRRTGSRRLRQFARADHGRTGWPGKIGARRDAGAGKIGARQASRFCGARLWQRPVRDSSGQLRREFSFSLRDTGLIKLNQDIVVPRSRLEDLFHFTARLQKKFGLPIACFGHAGDGNIHVNVMYDKNWPEVEARTRAALDELFRQVLAWNGVITGEHGIGLAKKRWWPLAASPAIADAAPEN